MTVATGNFYCGLYQYEDMAFVLDLLRPEDTFVDIGANIGPYSILASGHVGAISVAVEPVPATFAKLRANMLVNDLDELVFLHNVGIGDSESSIRFTSTLGAGNHVATDTDPDSKCIEVPVVSLDHLLKAANPLCIKIDVEGFEKKVIDGGIATLGSESVRAVLIEMNGNGIKYGFNDDEIHQAMLGFGFSPFTYDPSNREIYAISNRNLASDNTIYIRDVEFVKKRLSTAPDIELPWRAISRAKAS